MNYLSLCRFGHIQKCIYGHSRSEILQIGARKIQAYSILLENLRHLYGDVVDLISDSGSPTHDDDAEITKVLLPLIDDINIAFMNRGIFSPIFQAAMWGHINTIKLVVPLVDYPNAIAMDAFWSKITPSDIAERSGHHEAAKFLKAYEKQ